MQSYMQSSHIRRSYEPPAPTAAARAGVGLLFSTSADGKIVVKEVVKGGSAARNAQIKPTDVIVRVGNMNVQNQSLVHLRELILGEPGTFVTLGFSKGGTSQFYEVSLMRGSPEYLDQHQPQTTASKPLTNNLSTSTTSNNSNSMYQPPPTVSATSSRELDEIERLRAALSASQAEVSRLRANLRSQELLVERNGEELRTYRETLEQRESENRQGRNDDDRRKQDLLADFKRKFDRERAKLATALEKSQTITRNLNAVIPTLNSMERELGTDGAAPLTSSSKALSPSGGAFYMS